MLFVYCSDVLTVFVSKVNKRFCKEKLFVYSFHHMSGINCQESVFDPNRTPAFTLGRTSNCVSPITIGPGEDIAHTYEGFPKYSSAIRNYGYSADESADLDSDDQREVQISRRLERNSLLLRRKQKYVSPGELVTPRKSLAKLRESRTNIWL